MLPLVHAINISTCSHAMYRDLESGGLMEEASLLGKRVEACESSSREGRTAASKSHSEAERRRRERINSHLATLRSLLPSTSKTDKASLLAEVIAHVKELRRKAAEVRLGSLCGFIPSEADEVTVESEPCSPLIKATVCCHDRPDLLLDLSRMLRVMRVRAVKAEISTLGGRMRNVLLIQLPDLSQPCVASLCHALRTAMDKPSLSSGIKKPRPPPHPSLSMTLEARGRPESSALLPGNLGDCSHIFIPFCLVCRKEITGTSQIRNVAKGAAHDDTADITYQLVASDVVPGHTH